MYEIYTGKFVRTLSYCGLNPQAPTSLAFDDIRWSVGYTIDAGFHFRVFFIKEIC